MRSLCAMCFSLLEKQEMRAGQGSRVRAWRKCRKYGILYPFYIKFKLVNMGFYIQVQLAFGEVYIASKTKVSVQQTMVRIMLDVMTYCM